MSVLLTLEIIVILLIGKKFYDFFLTDPKNNSNLKRGLPEILQVSLFAFFTGIFGQCIGLIQAFDAIESMGKVSQAILAGGLKVSMITTLYGMSIFALAAVCWFFLNQRYQRLIKKDIK